MARDNRPDRLDAGGSTTAVWPIVRDALTHASAPIKRLIRAMTAGWLLMLALQVWDSRNGQGASGIAEFASVLFGITGLGLLGLAHTLQLSMEEAAARTRPAANDTGLTRVLLALPAVGVASAIAMGAAAVLMLMRGVLTGEWPFALAGAVLYGSMVIVAARTVVRASRTLYSHASHQAHAAATQRTAANTARLDALQARMNPHVLFNALNTVASLVRTNPPAAERVVEALSDVLRQTLDRSATTDGTVRDEVAYVRSCLALEEERWGPHLRVTWSIDADVLDSLMPPFIIQPLVENALHHGLGSKLDGGHIRISITTATNSLIAAVEDDGSGFRPQWKDGTGLGNLRQRLAAMHGTAASLTITPLPTGSRVTVTLPR